MPRNEIRSHISYVRSPMHYLKAHFSNKMFTSFNISFWKQFSSKRRGFAIRASLSKKFAFIIFCNQSKKKKLKSV